MLNDLTRSVQRQAIVIQCTGNKCLAEKPGNWRLELKGMGTQYEGGRVC